MSAPTPDPTTSILKLPIPSNPDLPESQATFSDPPNLPPKPARPSPLLETPDIQPYLASLQNWTLGDVTGHTALARDYKFAKFKYAVQFFNDLVGIINADNHHPVVTINFRDVSVRTYTHVAYKLAQDGSKLSGQGVTGFDIRLALRTEALYDAYVARGWHKVLPSKA
ncbi:hypothetical protein FRB99_003304 [Tulasnella sp. 403]|nr:hypothetical protein FRB99_003304 [Tulasnella sp. 403]